RDPAPAAPEHRRAGLRAGRSAEQHDDQDHDHHHDDADERGHDRLLAPPELGLGAVAGVAALGRRPDPVVIVVVRAHRGVSSLAGVLPGPRTGQAGLRTPRTRVQRWLYPQATARPEETT